MINQLRIKDFREIIQKAYLDKGIHPPVEGSKKEQEMYQKWIKTIQDESK